MKKIKKITMVPSIFLIFSLLVISGIPAYADLIYSTLGSDYTYDSGGIVVGGDEPANYTIAVSFTPSSNFNLSSIDIAARKSYLTSGNDLTVNLTNGYGTAAIETFTIPITSTTSGIHIADISNNITADPLPLLLANTKYYVVLSAPVNNEFVWNFNNKGFTGFYNFTGGSFPVNGTTPVFAVYGTPANTPIPEPGTMMLLGSGLVGLVGYGRRWIKK